MGTLLPLNALVFSLYWTRDPLTPLDHSTMPKNKPDPKTCIFLPQYCPRQVMHIPCPRQGSIPRASHKNATDSETLQVLLFQGEHQQWESSLHAVSSAGLLQPQNESLPFPKQLKQAPTPLIPKAFPQGERWNRKRMARTERQKLCRKLGVLSAWNSQSRTRGRVRCQSVHTPKSAMVGLRAQPKECNPWWSAAPCTHLGPKSQEELY